MRGIRVLSVALGTVLQTTGIPIINDFGPSLASTHPAELEDRAARAESISSLSGNDICPGASINGQHRNQCQTGVPYCCSPTGEGSMYFTMHTRKDKCQRLELTVQGTVCSQSNVDCKQTVICCNSFSGVSGLKIRAQFDPNECLAPNLHGAHRLPHANHDESQREYQHTPRKKI